MELINVKSEKSRKFELQEERNVDNLSTYKCYCVISFGMY